jgi:hypothetical protein
MRCGEFPLRYARARTRADEGVFGDNTLATPGNQHYAMFPAMYPGSRPVGYPASRRRLYKPVPVAGASPRANARSAIR